MHRYILLNHLNFCPGVTGEGVTLQLSVVDWVPKLVVVSCLLYSNMQLQVVRLICWPLTATG